MRKHCANFESLHIVMLKTIFIIFITSLSSEFYNDYRYSQKKISLAIPFLINRNRKISRQSKMLANNVKCNNRKYLHYAPLNFVTRYEEQTVSSLIHK